MSAPSEARDRLSLVAHAALPLCGPLTLAELDLLIAPARVERGEHVVDLGAGRGDAGAHVARTRGARVTLVDRSAVFAAAARARDAEVVIADAAAYLDALEGTPALMICLGASHALGGIEPAARRLAPLARHVLLGDLVALGERAAQTFGAPRLDALPRPDLVLGPARLRAYELAWSAAVRAHLDAHPDEPAREWALARLTWMQAHDAALDELAFAVWLTA